MEHPCAKADAGEVCAMCDACCGTVQVGGLLCARCGIACVLGGMGSMWGCK